MDVRQLRKKIQKIAEPFCVVSGRKVWKTSTGELVSKAKKASLEAYLRELTLPSEQKAMGGIGEINRKIAICDRRIRKYAKRTQGTGNVRSGNRWKAKKAKLEKLLG